MAEKMKHRLTEAAWPVFEFLINFGRQVKYGNVPAPEQVRYEALSSVRDGEDIARDEPVTERCWNDRIKAMLVYLIDYKLLNTNWRGQSYWFDNRFETDQEILNHVESLGGDKFFEDCDELQREYELAERRDRRDKDELAEMLNLYFVALRLGFKGRFHDRPQELADYVRKLYSRLPAYGSTRAKEMFPDAYENVSEERIDYKLGMSLSVIAAMLLCIVIFSGFVFRIAWQQAVGDIETAANSVKQGEFFQADSTGTNAGVDRSASSN